MFPREKKEEKPIQNNKQQSLNIISLKWDEKIATIYFRESEKVAMISKTIGLWGFS